MQSNKNAQRDIPKMVYDGQVPINAVQAHAKYSQRLQRRHIFRMQPADDPPR